jgi:hypothetical protein
MVNRDALSVRQASRTRGMSCSCILGLGRNIQHERGRQPDSILVLYRLPYRGEHERVLQRTNDTPNGDLILTELRFEVQGIL